MLSSTELQILALSLRVGVVGTTLGLPVALFVGWLLAKSSIRGKAILDMFVSFPLVLPPVVTGYFLLVLLSRGGPIGGPLHTVFGVDVIFTWVAAALASGLVALPLMVRAIEISMAGVDPRLELAARSLGAGPFKVFFTITIPLAYRGILAAVLLAFARAIGEFGATMVVAGNIPGRTQTLPSGIYLGLQTGDDASALRLIAISLVLAMSALILHHKMAQRVVYRI